MPSASAPSTSRRLLELLTLLQTRRDWPAQTLAERLGVSDRTVRRDVERLRELDYVVDATRGPDGGYRLRPGARLPPLLLDDGQAVAIALTLRTAGSTGAAITEDAERALVTLRQLLPERLAHRVEHLAAIAAPRSDRASVDPALLARIGETVRAHRELRFDYDAPGAEPAAGPPRRIQPHHLLLHGGRWYLLGFSAERDEWRVYRVDRLTPRTHDGASFVPREVPGGDPARFLAARFAGARDGEEGWPCRGSAVLPGAASDFSPYVGDGTVEELGDGRCRVTLGSWSWGALVASFARFETAISEVEPAELRSAFREQAARLAAACDA